MTSAAQNEFRKATVAVVAAIRGELALKSVSPSEIEHALFNVPPDDNSITQVAPDTTLTS